MRPRVSGILERWNYREGAKVAAGQSLFTIDSAPYRAALARAEAQLASAEASLAQSSRDAVRLKPLFEAKAVSQKDYDDAASSAQVASANVKAAQAAVTEARLNLSYTPRARTGITSLRCNPRAPGAALSRYSPRFRNRPDTRAFSSLEPNT